MMIDIPIRTERMELIPATLEHLTCELHNKDKLSRLLQAAIPSSWPPAMVTEEVISEFIRMKAEQTDPFFVLWYWVVHDTISGECVLVGSGGISSSFESLDTVVLGYSVLKPFQNRGYATEAVRNIIPVIFSQNGIRRIIASTYPDLPASIRVLEKTGFIPDGPGHAGEGLEEGTFRYVREKGFR